MSKKIKSYIGQEIVLYIVTVLGVLMSPFVPSLVAIIIYGIIPEMVPNVWHPVRIGAILFVALLMKFLIERKGEKEGKMQNFRKRLLQHLGYGALWFTVIESIVEGVKIGRGF